MSSSRFFSAYLRARDAYQRGKYQAAVSKLVPLFTELPNANVNHLLVRALYRLRRYGPAKFYMVAMINTYAVNACDAALMIRVLARNHNFVMAQEILVTFRDRRLVRQLSSELASDEDRFRVAHAKSLRKIASSFYHLSEDRFADQRRILRTAETLPVKQFIKVAVRLLVDPFLHPLMRVSILDVVRKVKLMSTVHFRWLDGREHPIVPGRLPELTTTRSYRRINAVINSSQLTDPKKLLMLRRNLRLALTYLYPFNDRIVKDPGKWVEVANWRSQNFKPDFHDSATRRVYAWQVKLARLTRDLTR